MFEASHSCLIMNTNVEVWLISPFSKGARNFRLSFLNHGDKALTQLAIRLSATSYSSTAPLPQLEAFLSNANGKLI